LIPTPWLTKSEAAEYARVSEATIDRWRLPDPMTKQPRLKSIKTSDSRRGTVLIHRDDLDLALREGLCWR
jgi:hypothetical protein